MHVIGCQLLIIQAIAYFLLSNSEPLCPTVEKPRLLLKYWDGRGLMEVPRMLLAIAGKFPVSYRVYITLMC
jgi:hypothetical protein